MSHTQFIMESTNQIIAAIRESLAADSPTSVRNAAESIFDAWGRVQALAPPVQTEGECELWCAVWTAQHLADVEHWKDGVAPRDFTFLLQVLEKKEPLPKGWSGCRP